MNELTGTISRILFAKDDFTIAALANGPAVKGPAAVGDLKAGLTYRFFGRTVEHPQYGAQFLFSSFAVDVPHDREGVTTYLAKEADGIGVVAAGKLWDAFGTRAVEVIVSSPDEAVEAKCVSKLVAQRAHASLSEKVAFQKTRIDLLGVFHKLGFPGSLIPRLIEKWGVAAPTIVREDPFRLLLEELPGCGFKRIDLLHHDLGHPHTSSRRQMVCAWNRVHANRDGHTWLEESAVVRLVAEEIGGDSDPSYAVEQAVEGGLLMRRDSGGSAWLAVPRKGATEASIAESVARLLSVPPTAWPDAASLADLSEHQRGVAGGILRESLALLTGCPGTGKTFCAARIVRGLGSLVPPDEIAVCAPTGKAAVRITKAMHDYGLPFEATTVHRLLKVCGSTRDGYLFERNRANPLPFRVVVLDEVSMMDSDLMAAFLDALDAGTHLLLVGDPHQLPPVGHGAPLRDLIESGVLPSGALSEIRRNSGQIVAACRSIKDGFRYETSTAFGGVDENFRSMEVAGDARIVESIRAVCRRLVARSAAGELADFDPVEDVQVLCILNEQSPLGRVALNRVLQEEMNPRGASHGPHPFRVGDKVICQVNGRMPAMEATPGGPADAFDGYYKTPSLPRERYVANGDMGRVLAASAARLIVRFAQPERLVCVNLPAAKESSGGEEVGSAWGPVELGYAITAHKSQGSEWPFVILPIDENERTKGVASRELLYTAISRAKWRCLLIGRRAVADEWCQTVVMRKRKTLLRDALRERIAATRAKGCTA